MDKAPKLRFKEFSRDWESKKLGELLEFKNGINASKEQYGHGKKFINVLDILNNNYITHENIVGKVDVDEVTFEKYSVGYGDVVFQRSSETREEVGTANVYLDKDNKATFGGFIIRGKKIGEYDPIFMNKLLKSSTSRKEITTKSGGSTRYNVGQETLSEVSLLFPKLEEQEKIASFFSLIDDKISLQGEKVEALKYYKKGMMQKIFSRDLRFKDDDGRDYPQWEDKMLGEIGSVVTGNTPATKDKDNYGNEYLWASPTDLGVNKVIDNTVNKLSSKGFEKIRKVPKGSILVTCIGSTIGKIGMAYEEMSTNQQINTLICNDDMNNEFIYYSLEYNFPRYLSYVTSQAVPIINKTQFQEFHMNVPILNEQIKIGQILNKIELKIEKEQEKLDSLNEYKNGLLQQMFV